MTSLGEKIARLTDRTPQLIDPEDIDSSAEICTDVDNQIEENEISDLRRKTAPLLEDIDLTYAGQKVSRKALGHFFSEDDKKYSSTNDSYQETDDAVSHSEDSEEEDYDEEEDDNFEIKDFKELIASKSKESGGKESYDEESDEEEYVENKSDEMTKQFSNIDMTSDIERGQAIKNQNEIWNRLMETRIKLQKLLVIANKLPQFSSWKRLREKGGKELNEAIIKGSQSMKQLSKSWVDLQASLLDQNREIQSSNNKESTEIADNSDEEIPSGTDDEVDDNNFSSEKEKKGMKRKLEEDYATVLEKRFKSIIPYRNSTIQKWDEKTRLSMGRMTQKSFTAFDMSALKQIEQNLQDKSRLIRRTQLKRSLYRVLGKSETLEKKDTESSEAEISKQDMILKDFDPEIFDDDDFYRQLLKEIIESKSFGVDAAAIRKQIDIQKMRNKMKRKVDTKASKGRRLRYDVHPKIVNFLAEIENNEMPDNARESFLKCVFAGMNSSK